MNKNIIVLIAGFIAILAYGKLPQADFRVVPLPNTIEKNEKGKSFILTKECGIECGGDTLTARLLAEDVEKATGFRLEMVKKNVKKNRPSVKFEINNSVKHPEGYEIRVNNKNIIITASTRAGLFYGCKTLFKSLPQIKADSVEIPAYVISDAPRFSYRGMLLDCGRHFFPIKDVKTFIDMLALHNMNTLHWHLTEDQGWRFEVKKHPVLTDIGSKRRGSEIGWAVGLNDSIPHEGYYSQDDCREIIRYAAERNITVIPEIDIPGHTTSLLACFPELGCTGGPYTVSDHWGVHEDIVCAGNDKTFEILQDVFDEICDVFPSEYINIGGDEAPKTRWEKCPKCQARIEKEGITASDSRTKESALQGWFTRQIEQYLNKKGRKVIGWNEIAETGASATSAIMNRYDSVATATAVREGRDVVVNTSAYCYFDYPQSSDLRLEPKLFPLGETVGLSRVYSLEPVPDGLSEEEKSHILGVQANVWGEFISKLLLVQYQTLPRMAAMSEVQWTESGNKNYKDFLHRLPGMRKVYDTHGYFHKAHFE